MHSIPLKNLVLLTLLAVILAACSAPLTTTVQPAVEVQPTPTMPAVAPTATDAPTAVPPTETPTEIPVGVSTVSFSQDVLPILRASCISCHGSTRQRAGLMLNTYEALMAGASGEAVIIPNDAAASLLVQVITSGEMPKNDTKLSDAEVKLISDWVNAGALDN